MEFKIDKTENQIVIFLPMTTPTGKVRVKRPINERQPEPVATRQKTIGPDDYIEWQISYYIEKAKIEKAKKENKVTDPSVLEKITIMKGKKIFYGTELTRLIVESMHLGILSQQNFEHLARLVNTPFEDGIEESNEIFLKESSDDSVATQQGFNRFTLEGPFYKKIKQKYTIQITISNRQYAVGKQAMIYLCLPISDCTSRFSDQSFIGRKAEKKEQAKYYLNSQNSRLISDLVATFAIASQQHRDDLKLIFEKVAVIL